MPNTRQLPIDARGVPGALEEGADPTGGVDDRSVVRRRPAETAAGLTIAAAVYGFLAEAGVPNEIAAVLAVVVAFVPGAVSWTVDAVQGE